MHLPPALPSRFETPQPAPCRTATSHAPVSTAAATRPLPLIPSASFPPLAAICGHATFRRDCPQAHSFALGCGTSELYDLSGSTTSVGFASSFDYVSSVSHQPPPSFHSCSPPLPASRQAGTEDPSPAQRETPPPLPSLTLSLHPPSFPCRLLPPLAAICGHATLCRDCPQAHSLTVGCGASELYDLGGSATSVGFASSFDYVSSVSHQPPLTFDS